VRSFVAVLLDEATRVRLGEEIERLRGVTRGVAWVPPDNLHVTLKFLGEVEEARLGRVAEALQGPVAAAAPFGLAVEGVGAFPSPARPRVVWAGTPGGAEELGALARRVEAALAPLGFAPEGRPFAGHVTLGRVREPRRDGALAAAMAASAGRAYGTVRVEWVSLMRSDLGPGGARYSELRRLLLLGARGVGVP